MIFKRTLLLALCICSAACAMQQQQQVQQQEQRHHEPHHQPDQSDSDEQPNAEDSQLADLNALMQNLVNTVIQTHGSVDALVKQQQKRKIVCHICGREDCGVYPSREEIY